MSTEAVEGVVHNQKFATWGTIAAMASPSHRVVSSRWEVLAILLIAPWALATPQDTGSSGTVSRFDTEAETTHRRITWDDFQAKPSRFEGEQARISTTIKSDPFDVRVRLTNRGYWVAVPLEMAFYGVMDKRTSGVGKGARTDLLLTHEQGHFDLTEIASRGLAQRLGGVEGQGTTGDDARANVLEKIQQAYDQAVLDLDEQQARYDRETRHGQSVRGQRDWNDRLARMLRGAPSQGD